MGNFWTWLFSRDSAIDESSTSERMKLDELHSLFLNASFIGSSGIGGETEFSDGRFVDYVRGAYKSNGVVFACMLTRQLIFSEARFVFQRMRNGRPGGPNDVWGNAELDILNKPWPSGTTGELLARAIQDADLAGNHYLVREGNGVRRLRPDWVEVILDADPTIATRANIAGYLYTPGGSSKGSKDRPGAKLYLPEEVAHWSPIPDPEAQYIGMSWLTPILREIDADRAATTHKAKFFDKAATPPFAVSLKEGISRDQFKEFMEEFLKQHTGAHNAYKPLFLGQGADVKTLGTDLKQLDFKATQGAGETRIAAAARTHPVLVGLSEGMQGSSLNAGNFRAAKDGFADGTMRPLWRSICAAYEKLLNTPSDSRLWYDEKNIPFVLMDRTEMVEIQAAEVRSLTRLVQEGFTAESAKEYLISDDISKLEHTGLLSVQLQPPGLTAKGEPVGQEQQQQGQQQQQQGQQQQEQKPADAKTNPKKPDTKSPAPKQESKSSQRITVHDPDLLRDFLAKGWTIVGSDRDAEERRETEAREDRLRGKDGQDG